MNKSFSHMKRLCVSLTVFVTAMIYGTLPAFAAEVEGGDATKNVAKMETEYKWFYWPGWAFAALTALVLALVVFAWYKSVLGPKYRGKKVAQ